jgi:hypothetical protein
MASKFSDDVLKALSDAQPLNAEKCATIGAEFGYKQRSMIACAKRQGFTYERKVRVNKQGEKPVSKADLVASIADALDVSVASLDGLDKANKTALEALIASIPELDEPSES